MRNANLRRLKRRTLRRRSAFARLASQTLHVAHLGSHPLPRVVSHAVGGKYAALKVFQRNHSFNTMTRIFFSFFLFFFLSEPLFAQENLSPIDSIKIKIGERNERRDSLYIAHIEDRHEPDKVLHAEPLFIDLIRDLGARKGEAEWNVGLGLTDNTTYDAYAMLIEYEFAPINRLGLEFEIPITINRGRQQSADRPSSRIESIKFAAQWSFFISQELKTSMALGYLNELKFSDLDVIKNAPVFMGNLYNPFFVVAKRWGNNWHSLAYTGFKFFQDFQKGFKGWEYEANTSVHYMISGTRNFIGVEFNKSIADDGKFNMVIRPQMRLTISHDLMLGIVVGIPINQERERLSTFLRLIYEPDIHSFLHF